MARKTSQPPASPPPLELLVSREDAEAKIIDRVAKGKNLFAQRIDSWNQLEATSKDYLKWSAYNTELLKRLFSNDSLAQEYALEFGFAVSSSHPSLRDEIQEHYKHLDDK